MNLHKSMISGDHLFASNSEFDGMIAGDVTVGEGVVLTLKGMVNGDLLIGRGATVHLGAVICGQVINKGGTLLVA